VLVAESRLGKTRVVQEFYGAISRDQDAQHYWPDAMEPPHPGGRSDDRANLTVNPAFSPQDQPRADIPWLWWGLRWPPPDDENLPEDRGCAALDNLHHLEPHVMELGRQAEERDALTGMAVTFTTTLLSLFPIVSAAGSVKDLWDRWQSIGKVREATQVASMDVATSSRYRDDTALDALLSVLTQVLGSDALADGGLPSVLVLDNAHWADRDSLRLINRLLRTARQRSWPLLVLATCWEQEWNRHESAPLGPSATSNPSTLSELIRALDPTEGADQPTTVVLEPLADLTPVVMNALPGLTEPQRRLFSEKAEGSPGLLHQMLHDYLINPVRFVGKDVAAPLTAKAERELLDKQFPLHALVRERLARLDDTVRELLGLGSYQGVRFLQDLTRELARRIYEERGSSAEEISPSLAAAHRPHAVVQEVAVNTSEFRQRIYRELSLEYLNEQDDEDTERLRGHIRALLRERMAPASFDALRPYEQEALSRLAVQEFGRADAAGESARAEVIQATAALVLVLADRGVMSPLTAAWTAWTDLTREDEEGTTRHLSLLQHRRLAGVALDLGAIDVAERLARAVLLRAETEPGLVEEARIVERAAAANMLGIILRERDKPDEAVPLLTDAVQLRRRILAGVGASPTAERELATSLISLGSLLQVQDQPETAEALFREALERSIRVLETSGRSADHLDLAATSRDALAGLLRDRDQPEKARTLLKESLDIRQAVVDEFGPSVEHLRDVSASLHNLGVLLVEHDELADAESLVRRAVALDKRIIVEFGPSAGRLNDLGLSLGSLGDVLRGREQWAEAGDSYREAMDVHQQIAGEFDASSYSLLMLDLSLVRLARFLIERGDHAAAEKLLSKSLELNDGPLAAFGPSEDRLRELSTGLRMYGIVHGAFDRPTDAEGFFRRALAVDEDRLRRYGRSAVRLEELGADKDLLARAVAKNDPIEAEALYRDCVDLAREVVSNHETTSERNRELLVALVSLGEFLQRTKPTEAEAFLREALEVGDGSLRRFGRSRARLHDPAYVRNRIARLIVGRNQVAEAEVLARESLELSTESATTFGLSADSFLEIATALGALAFIAEGRDDVEDARASYREGLETARRYVEEFPGTTDAEPVITRFTSALARLEGSE
jgi:tetratricopeptide (TPR) repeat protein